jgi:hypothetical protein
MFGLESILEGDLPTRPQTVALFTLMGFTHGILVNLLDNRPFYYRPLWAIYRTGCGAGLGLIVDRVAPYYKRRMAAKRRFEDELQEWKKGVLRRREMEMEILGQRN